MFQFVSFIAMPDIIRAIIFILQNENIAGPVNVTAPHPLSNKEFTKALAKALKRPAFLFVPRQILKLFLGEQGRVVLDSTRAFPEVLIDQEFKFNYENASDYFAAIFTTNK